MNDRLKGRLGRHRTSVKDTAWTSNGQPSHYSEDDDDDVGDGDGHSWKKCFCLREPVF